MKVPNFLYKFLFDIYKVIPKKARYVNSLKKVFPQYFENEFTGYVKMTDDVSKDQFWMYNRTDSYMENEFKAYGIYGGWEKESLKIWAQLCHSANIILDIGANTGVFSLLARCQNADSTIIAVEPVDLNYTVLQKNIAINRFKIKAEKLALSATDGTATMYMLKDRLNYMTSVNDNRYLQHPEITGNHEVIPVTVEVKTYQYIESKYAIKKIDLIKIDVEGHEFSVLNAMLAQITRDRPVILVEIIGDDNAAGLNTIFKNLGYRFVSIDEVQQSVVVDELWDNDHHNFLVCHDETIKFLQDKNLVK